MICFQNEQTSKIKCLITLLSFLFGVESFHVLPKMATITLTWMIVTPKKLSLGGFDKCHSTYTNVVRNCFGMFVV